VRIQCSMAVNKSTLIAPVSRSTVQKQHWKHTSKQHSCCQNESSKFPIHAFLLV
jgi:hypothetical protein